MSMQTISKVFLRISMGAALLLQGKAAFADAPTYVRVRSISYAGSGCPAGSVAKNVSQDRQAFTLLFDQYIAEVGPGVPFIQRRKNCQLTVDLDFPSGWTYTVVTVDTRGYIAADPGTNVTQQSSYYFQGQARTARASSSAWGPLDENYQLRDVVGVSSLVWSPCGERRALNINTEVKASNSANPSGHALITTDSIDGSLKQIYALQWARCR